MFATMRVELAAFPYARTNPRYHVYHRFPLLKVETVKNKRLKSNITVCQSIMGGLVAVTGATGRLIAQRPHGGPVRTF